MYQTSVTTRPLLYCAVVLMTTVAIRCTPSTPSTQTGPVDLPPPAMVEPARATFPDGHVITVELALTQEEIRRGLMFRPSLGGDRGMLFLFQKNRIPSFWMKNTLIPLDLVFLDDVGTVAEVIAKVQPCATDPCPTYSPREPARAVLELAAGVAAAHGLGAGATISFDRVPGYPIEKDENTVPQ